VHDTRQQAHQGSCFTSFGTKLVRAFFLFQHGGSQAWQATFDVVVAVIGLYLLLEEHFTTLCMIATSHLMESDKMKKISEEIARSSQISNVEKV
jgi:hypothetical protein